MNNKPTKRRRFLVERRVQGALGLRIAMHWGIFMVTTAALTTGLRVIGSIEHPSVAELIGVALREQTVSFVVILALLPWFLHDALKLSNRFAGPIHRLKDSLKNLADGSQVQELKFRDNDFWRELSEDFNRVAKRVSQPAAKEV